MATQWFKFYGGEYLSDPKMLALSACERSCWLTLLCYASMEGNDGVVRYLNESQLMAQSGIHFEEDEWTRTKGVLEHLERLGMVRISNGEVTVLNWKKRQEAFLTNAERQARFREKNKIVALDSNADVTPQSNKSNARIEKNRIEKNNTYAHGFNQFWEKYPRKDGKKKADQVWTRIKPDPTLLGTILAALEAYKACDQWTKDDGRFIPHAATWLNGERWNDEIKVGKKRTTKYDNIGTTAIRQ